MKRGIFLIILPSIAIFFTTSIFAAQLKKINFEQVGQISQLRMVFDKPNVVASKFHFQEDKQILIDLKDVSATQRVIRGFDTSEFSGSTVFVRAYKKPATENDLRIAIQLRDNVRSVLQRKENELILNIENHFGALSKDMSAQIRPGSGDSNGIVKHEVHVPKSDSIEDILENLTLAGKKKYIGKKISLIVNDISVIDLLRMISEASGFNIIMLDELKKLPPLTLNLTNTPWDHILDLVLNLNKLVARRSGTVLTVLTLERATKERQLEAEAKKAAKKEEPLVTKVFQISYANLKDLSKIIKDYLTANRGKIAQDVRTSTLIVKDTVLAIERIRKIIETLDTQTAQILIESKIIEVEETYAKNIGLTRGIGFGYDPISSMDTISSSSTSAEGLSADSGPGFIFSSASIATASAKQAFGVSVGRFGRLFDLNFNLNLMESEQKGKVIASPKVVTQNNQKAEINRTDSRYVVSDTTTEGGVISYETDPVTASLSLAVTPQVTNEGAIVMAVEIEKEDFLAAGQPSKRSRKVKTSVLVENGSTVVLGGIYSYKKEENHQGILFLKDIPLIGWLFRTPYNPQTTKTELMVFITPRIINQQKAGLGMDMSISEQNDKI